MQHRVKILVIRFSSIGDIVLTTPVLRCLKNQLEGDVELHYLTKKQYGLILENNPNVDKVYSIEKSTSEVVSDLKDEMYDYVVDLHKNLRSKRVVKNLKCINFSFEKLNYQKWLMTTFKKDKLPRIHIVQRYLDAVKPLGIENDNQGLEYYIPDADNINQSSLPETHQKGYVAFAIGAQHATKRLPEHKIISICKKMNVPIVVLGGKEDEAVGDVIQKEVGERVYNACGKYNLNQSASIIEYSKVLITHDTGLMHIGAALGIKTVSVWGNTIPEFGMYPYFPNHPEKFVMIENKNLNCRPCTKIGHDQCPKKHFKCMEEIEDTTVVDAALNFYNN